MNISIITASYNSQDTIKDTLESVANQNNSKIEHIIIDGASSDNTLDIVRQFSHVSQVLSEPDKGIYDAMNKGVKMATGDIVAILNSDDFYMHDNVINSVLQVFEVDQVDSVYGNLQYVSEVDTSKVVRKWIAKDYNRAKFLYGWMPPHPSFFLKREMYDKYGTFNTNLTSAADYELMLRMLYKNEISTSYIDDVLVGMRTGGQSNQSVRNRIAANIEDQQAWKINGLKPKFYTTYLKPIRKIRQYIIK